MMQDVSLFGILAATGASATLGVTLILDRVMVADCYRGSSRQAWAVSSVLGTAFGLLATAAVWLVAAATSDTTLAALAATCIGLAWPQGLLMLLAGAITVQTMAHYFALFTSDGDDQPNETLIALWLASSPVWIFLSTLALSWLGADALRGTGIAKSNKSLLFAASIIVAVLCLAAVELFDSPVGQRSTVRYTELVRMLACIVACSLVVSAVLRADDAGPLQSAALQPWYWLGYLAGARVLLHRQDRRVFRANWPRLRLFARLILTVEVLGMLVYFLEYHALGSIDPALVNLVVGGHVVVVFVLSLLLSRTRARLTAAGIRRKWVWGLRLVTHRLPDVRPTPGSVLRLGAAQVAILFAIYASAD